MVAQEFETSGLGNAALLGRIDQLFACGASQYVDIPQIVVVGDQSSGKSSVLSSLIGKDLPRDHSLCTRYATKIVFRRSSEKFIRISIIPDPKSSSEHQKDVKSWETWKRRSFDEVNFEEIMHDVNRKIGIKDANNASTPGKVFSGDVLQLEISGPHEQHLSVIDVPGIFRDPEPGKTTKDDMDFVRKLVTSYMANRRSVMLAVIPANVDLATQEILQMANEVDPEGDRTLGVLTKPDLIDEGAERPVIDILEGRVRSLKLGWHVVRNAGQKDLLNKALDRQARETEFFTVKLPWFRLDSSLWGIETLRTRLREILGNLIEREFAHVKAEIQQVLIATEQKVKDLGPERDSRPAQAAFLTDLSTEFQDLVRDALAARFGSNDIFAKHRELMIAPAVIERMENFTEVMAEKGHNYSLEPPALDSQRDAVPVSRGNDSETIRPSKKSHFPNRQEKDIRDLADILEPLTMLSRCTENDPEKWLRELHKTSRGFELGTFDPVILASAMRKQTAKWRAISLGYASDIVVIVHKFILTALKTVCKTDRLQMAIYNFIDDDVKSRYKMAIEQVKFILTVELDGPPMTMNHYFNDNLQTRRHTRMSDLWSRLQLNTSQSDSSNRIDGPTRSIPMTNKQYIVQDIHDILKSYYEVARKRFVDNVCKQATDHFLVNGPITPLTVFSPNLVSLMTDEQLEEIAGEEDRVKKQRQKLNKDIENLMKIKRILSSAHSGGELGLNTSG